MLSKVKNFALSNKTTLKRVLLVTVILALIFSMTMITFAAATEVKPEKIIGNLLSIIFQIVQYAGVILLVWGVVIMVLAIRNEDADSKTRAIMFILSAIVLICLKYLFKGLFSSLGLGITIS